jgi:HPt (histidine-containing phosphotransfer) domain-containing protein
MTQQPENGGSLKNLSDQALTEVNKQLEDFLVELELELRHCRLVLDMAREEQEFRKSGKSKRSPEAWEERWTEAVNEVARSYGLTPKDARDAAQRVIAKAKAQDKDKIKGH